MGGAPRAAGRAATAPRIYRPKVRSVLPASADGPLTGAGNWGKPMPTIEVEPSSQDVNFRREVLARLRSASSRVRVIAGELGSYVDYAELREAAHEAAARGASVTAYAHEPSSATLKSLAEANIEVTVGTLRSLHHYLEIDDDEVVTSLKDPSGRPTPAGSRRALVTRGDAELAQAIAVYDDFLTRAGRLRHGETRPLLDRLRELVGEVPALGRRVPLGENLLVLAGLDEEKARRFATEAREQVRQGLVDEHGTLGPLTETALVNEACLRTAYLL